MIVKKNRWLFQTLILSGILNLVLIALFFYFLIRENPLEFLFHPTAEVKVEKLEVSPSFITQLKGVEFGRLIELLNDTRTVGQGYRVCDFALSALAVFHDFDLRRALGKKELEERKWVFDEMTFTLYPGLSVRDFATLASFAKMELYPFTMKGLIERLDTNDVALRTYLSHTPPFILLEQLFSRTELPLSKGTLLALVQEGGSERLLSFYHNQEQGYNLSETTRRSLLLDYIEGGSKTAAYLLLITDPEYAYNILDDAQVLALLKQLNEKTQEAVSYVKKIATSPRSEEVCKEALSRLEEYTGEEIAGHYVPRPAIGELRPVFRSTPPAAPAPFTHLVQPGESLWLISRKYHVSIERIMEINRLSTTVIQPGKTLQIPPEK